MVRSRAVDVKAEYLDSLCERLILWAENKKSLTIPEFLSQVRIGYPYFKYLIENSNKLCNAYEYAKSVLCVRWINRALNHEKMSQHEAKLVSRYVRLYDTHGLDLDQQQREALVEVEIRANQKYAVENYADARLSEPYHTEYERNRAKSLREEPRDDTESELIPT